MSLARSEVQVLLKSLLLICLVNYARKASLCHLQGLKFYEIFWREKHLKLSWALAMAMPTLNLQIVDSTI